MPMKGSSFPTSEELAAALGGRLRQHRLARHQTQAALADKAGVSLKALQSLESGQGSSLSTYLRALKALELLDTLDVLAPAPAISPMDMLKSQKVRQRAPRRRS